MEGHDKTIYGAMYAPLLNSFRRHCVGLLRALDGLGVDSGLLLVKARHTRQQEGALSLNLFYSYRSFGAHAQ